MTRISYVAAGRRAEAVLTAHELRNALVPVLVMIDSDRSGALAPLRDGVQRALDFVDARLRALDARFAP